MNEYILNNPAKKQASVWTKLINAVFSQEDQLFPFWLLLGPVFTILSSAFFVSFFADVAIVMGFILSLSLLTIYRFRLIGFVFSTLLVIYPIFVKASCPSLLKVGFFTSFILSFVVFLLSVEEFYVDKENFLKLFSKAKEEGTLWNKRFETLSSKYEELKVKIEEQERIHLDQLQIWEEDKKSLEDLVRESSLDAVAEQKTNALLSKEITALKHQMIQLQSTAQISSVDEEQYLKQLEEIDALTAQVNQFKQEIIALKEMKETHVAEEEEWIRHSDKLEALQQENEVLKAQLSQIQESPEQFKLLEEENLTLKEVITHLEELNKQQAVEAEDWRHVLNELNELRLKYHQLEMLQGSKQEDKKQDKKKPRISDDELLFSFYDISNSAIENVLKYRQSQTPSY